MSETPSQVPTDLVVSMPEGVPDHYADFANVWHSQDTFVLDFLAMTSPMEPVTDESGAVARVRLNAHGVSRVRIPASQVWDIMKALEQQLTHYESQKKG